MTKEEQDTLQPLYERFYEVMGREYIPDLEELVDFFVNESEERSALEPED
jgi:hypothetical protein